MKQPLFRYSPFVAASGRTLNFKVECDALTPDDWAALAALVAPSLYFRAVEGVPRGGLPFAAALAPYVIADDPDADVLLVDDVCTTGGSLERHRAGRTDVTGLVVFARGPLPAWCRAVFIMDQLFQETRP